MTDRTLQKLLGMAFDMIHVPRSQNKHFTFLLDKSKIVSVGWNDNWTTHTKAKKLGYFQNAMHSELSAILRYRGPKWKIPRLYVVNVRVNTHGKICESHPCESCMSLLGMYNLTRVWHTTSKGIFVEM